MSKQTFNATTLLVPISCSKDSILLFLLRTLGIIGIIWIFLVCSSMDFPPLNCGKPVLSASCTRNQPLSLNSGSASEVHIVIITWVAVNECFIWYPNRKFPLKLLHGGSMAIIWRNYPVFLQQAFPLFMILQQRKHSKFQERTWSKRELRGFVYSIIWFIIKIIQEFLPDFLQPITRVAEQFSPKNESKTKKKTKLSLFSVERYAAFAHGIELR